MEKMDCTHIEKNLIFFLDKQLSEKETMDFNLHINQCGHCKSLVNNISEIYLSLGNHNDLPDDYYFYTRLKQKMDNRNSVLPLTIKKILQPVALGLLLLIGGFMGVYIGNQYKTISINTEDHRVTQLNTYAEENYLSEANNDNFEVLLTSNQ